MGDGFIARLEPTHRVRRFMWSLRRRPPGEAEDQWAAEVLGAPLAALFGELPAPDRRHSIAVAGAVRDSLSAAGRDPEAPEERWLTEAALLHDLGKAGPDLGLLGRVVATVLDAALPTRVADRIGGRTGDYLRYPALGADRLAAVGADPRVVAWAREHHDPEGAWTIPYEDARLLARADAGA